MKNGNKKYSKTIIPVIALILIAIVARYHFRKTDQSGTQKLGAIVFVTGDQAPIGEQVKNALLLANEADRAGGSKITIDIQDSHDDPKQALSIYNHYKQEKLPVVFSTGDQVGYALSPVASKDKRLLYMTVAASQDITGDYTYRGFITAKQQAEAIGTYAAKELKFKKIGVIAISNVFGDSFVAALKNTISPHGTQFTSLEKFNINDTEARTQAAKTIAQRPDAILVTGFGPAYPIVFQSLKQLGWKGPILSDATMSDPYFFNAIGVKNLDNIYYSSTALDITNPTSNKMRDFIAQFKQRFTIEPSFFAAFAYDSYNVLSDAIKQCGYRADSIKSCLDRTNNKEGVLGAISFENREMKVPLYIKKVTKGKIETLKTY